jgi:DNA-binding NtrC family response regulator
VLLLTHHFLRQSCQELNRDIREIDKKALEILKNYAWPGNVRELENTVKRAVMMARGASVTAMDLQLAVEKESVGLMDIGEAKFKGLSDSVISAFHAMLPDPMGSNDSIYHTLVAVVEYSLIDEALKISENNQVAASRLLGLHRTTLRNKLAENMADSDKTD